MNRKIVAIEILVATIFIVYKNMWRPVIEDSELEDKIRLKIENLVTILSNINGINDFHLLSKTGGELFFYNYYHQYSKSNLFDKKNIEIITELGENLDQSYSIIYSSGLSGMLFILNHLCKNNFLELDDDFFDLPKKTFSQLIESENIDYLHGSGGIALYLASINNNNEALLKQWCEKLESLAEKNQNSFAWQTKFGLETEGYCLGLAHGIPATILILIKILDKYNIPLAKELLEGASQFLISCKAQIIIEGYFPNSIMEKKANSISSHLSWCYGDLGCALALYKAGEYLKKQEYIDLALETFIFNTKKRVLSEHGVIDADFCHGSIGVAHIYARMYNYTGIEIFRETSEFWYKLTLEKACYEDGLAGFKHYSGVEEKFVNSYGLLEGVTGIGLSLMSAVSNMEPKWDECFLLS